MSRSGYTVLDLIANVGGLRTILMFVIGQFINYWSFNSAQNYMVSRLYTYRSRDDPYSYSSHTIDKEPKKIDGNTNGLQEYGKSLLPKKYKPKDDNHRSLTSGRAALDKETNIVQVVKN